MRYLISILLLLPLAALACDDHANGKVPSIHFDHAISTQGQSDDFAWITGQALSTPDGERWVMVTVENISAGRRLLDQRRLQALLANGDEIPALAFEQEVLSPGEVVTVAVPLGKHKFPVVAVSWKSVMD